MRRFGKKPVRSEYTPAQASEKGRSKVRLLIANRAYAIPATTRETMGKFTDHLKAFITTKASMGIDPDVFMPVMHRKLIRDANG